MGYGGGSGGNQEMLEVGIAFSRHLRKPDSTSGRRGNRVCALAVKMLKLHSKAWGVLFPRIMNLGPDTFPSNRGHVTDSDIFR
jgi:hypothetical protein